MILEVTRMKHGQFGPTPGGMAYWYTSSGTWFLALLVLAYFLANAGYIFLGFLAIVLGFLLLVGGMFAPSGGAPGGTRVAGGGGGEAPIIIQSGGGGGGGMPATFRFDANWQGPTSGEEAIGKRLGSMANFFGKSIGAMTGGKPTD